MPFEKLMIHTELLMKLCIYRKVHLHAKYIGADLFFFFVSEQEDDVRHFPTDLGPCEFFAVFVSMCMWHVYIGNKMSCESVLMPPLNALVQPLLISVARTWENF